MVEPGVLRNRLSVLSDWFNYVVTMGQCLARTWQIRIGHEWMPAQKRELRATF